MSHPKDILFAGEKPFPILPAVDHYAGSEKLMRKALQLQKELGPIFDITCDCEDGAHAGAERARRRVLPQCAPLPQRAQKRWRACQSSTARAAA